MRVYWIYSKWYDRWYNGEYTITQEAIERYPWKTIQEIYYVDTGKQLSETPFELFPLMKPEWQPMSLEDILKLLDGKDE